VFKGEGVLVIGCLGFRVFRVRVFWGEGVLRIGCLR